MAGPIFDPTGGAGGGDLIDEAVIVDEDEAGLEPVDDYTDDDPILARGRDLLRQDERKTKDLPARLRGLQAYMEDNKLSSADLAEVLAGETVEEKVVLPGIPKDAEIIDYTETYAVAMDANRPRLYHKGATTYIGTETRWSSRAAFERDYDKADHILDELAERKRGKSKGGGSGLLSRLRR